ncbi:vitamin K epoxide reductase family protein [Rubrobacter tropicus]|uniref:vitamin K epoxide reductase family protein n=1 Tax=Rubrobacter tropicus TaxID=2653851 RepID=UPI00140A9519|nr:vitamin K epoxide reductase family protein [Rubrobacter tropicus]
MGARGGHPGLRVGLALLAAGGVAISAYLTWSHLGGTAPVCVGGSGGCEAVQASRYSEILGVPVAALGLVAYAGLLLSAVFKGETAALLGLFIALVGTLFSAYLTYLEFLVIRAVCQWCVANAGIVVACLALGALRFRDTGTPVRETAGGR